MKTSQSGMRLDKVVLTPCATDPVFMSLMIVGVPQTTGTAVQTRPSGAHMVTRLTPGGAPGFQCGSPHDPARLG